MKFGKQEGDAVYGNNNKEPLREIEEEKNLNANHSYDGLETVK